MHNSSIISFSTVRANLYGCWRFYTHTHITYLYTKQKYQVQNVMIITLGTETNHTPKFVESFSYTKNRNWQTNIRTRPKNICLGLSWRIIARNSIKINKQTKIYKYYKTFYILYLFQSNKALKKMLICLFQPTTGQKPHPLLTIPTITSFFGRLLTFRTCNKNWHIHIHTYTTTVQVYRYIAMHSQPNQF